MNKILIIDDDIQISELIADFCTDCGFEVKTLNDSRLALTTAEEWRPDLITLDLEMPGKDGLEVLKELRGSALASKTPVIILSVVAHEATIKPEAVQGVFDKPIKFSRLLHQIRQLLQPATAA